MPSRARFVYAAVLVCRGRRSTIAHHREKTASRQREETRMTLESTPLQRDPTQSQPNKSSPSRLTTTQVRRAARESWQERAPRNATAFLCTTYPAMHIFKHRVKRTGEVQLWRFGSSPSSLALGHSRTPGETGHGVFRVHVRRLFPCPNLNCITAQTPRHISCWSSVIADVCCAEHKEVPRVAHAARMYL